MVGFFGKGVRGSLDEPSAEKSLASVCDKWASGTFSWAMTFWESFTRAIPPKAFALHNGLFGESVCDVFAPHCPRCLVTVPQTRAPTGKNPFRQQTRKEAQTPSKKMSESPNERTVGKLALGV